jgi:hypothetical protein
MKHKRVPFTVFRFVSKDSESKWVRLQARFGRRVVYLNCCNVKEMEEETGEGWL